MLKYISLCTLKYMFFFACNAVCDTHMLTIVLSIMGVTMFSAQRDRQTRTLFQRRWFDSMFRPLIAIENSAVNPSVSNSLVAVKSF